MTAHAPAKGTILLIDDEVKLRSLLSRIIRLEGFEVIESGDKKDALKILHHDEIEVVICDVKLPDAHGVDLVTELKAAFPAIEIILLTAFGNITDGVQAMKNGAFDYITKGDDNNKIIPLIYKAFEKIALSKRVRQLEKRLGDTTSFERILGHSTLIRQAVDAARRVATTDTTVLLSGETGTGKEIFAQAIHSLSSRNRQPFVAINCSAFSRDLLENELFGHRAGAFTGAIRDTKGIFEEANRGTVFLDEIGEMPPELQAKLLRVLETGQLMKLGDSKTTQVDLRIIAATNRDLKTEINTGGFREDLFYRISAFQINLPPLRQRKEDIAELAIHFIEVFANKTNKKIRSTAPAYFAALASHPWKGNIRELKNVIERSIILTDSGDLTTESLPPEFSIGAPSSLNGRSGSGFELAAAEKLHIHNVLSHTQGNKTEAARLLGIGLTTLYRKMEEYQLNS